MVITLPLLFVLVGLSAFFSSAETAFLSLQRVQLEHAVREGDARALRVAALLDSPGRLLSAVLLGNNLVNTGAAAVGTVIALKLVEGGSAVFGATVAITVLLVVFGEVGPKTIALHHAYPIARIYSLALGPWTIATRPIVIGLDHLSRLGLKLLGERPERIEGLTIGELRTAIVLGTEQGTLAEEESQMLLGALRLQHTPVRSLMTARVDVEAADQTDPIRRVAERLAQRGFLRMPVYAENVDEIVGYAHVSDVNRAMLADRGDVPVASIARPVLFEPEFAQAAAVLERMLESNAQLVILLDEYGSTAGLLTMEDLLEEVVGEIRSESGHEAPEVEVSPLKRTVVDGRLRLSELEEQLGVNLAHPDVETVAGLMLEHLQRVPRRGEHMEHGGYRFTVVSADARRIKLIAVEGADQPEL
jgi:putative hemolysin